MWKLSGKRAREQECGVNALLMTLGVRLWERDDTLRREREKTQQPNHGWER